MEEDILNYSPILSCFVGHPVYIIHYGFETHLFLENSSFKKITLNRMPPPPPQLYFCIGQAFFSCHVLFLTENQTFSLVIEFKL